MLSLHGNWVDLVIILILIFFIHHGFVIFFVISLPINPSIKTDISNSRIGGFILSKTAGIEKNFPQFKYLTVEPASHESIQIEAKIQNLVVDQFAETKMFNLVNQERVSRGIKALVWDTNL